MWGRCHSRNSTYTAHQKTDAVMEQLAQEVMELEGCLATIHEIPSLHIEDVKKWGELRVLDEHWAWGSWSNTRASFHF